MDFMTEENNEVKGESLLLELCFFTKSFLFHGLKNTKCFGGGLIIDALDHVTSRKIKSRDSWFR